MGQSYHVPRQFGIGFFLGITTALAILFASLRMLEAPPVIHLFSGSLSLLICIVQMRFEEDPRRASVLAGAVYLPLFFFGCVLYDSLIWRTTANGLDMCGAIFLAMPGAFAGYLMGLYLGACVMLMRWGDAVLNALKNKSDQSITTCEKDVTNVHQADGTTVP